MSPRLLGLLLVAPALPWLLWLFPASIPEAELPRALLWPGITAVAGALGWAGARLVGRRPT